MSVIGKDVFQGRSDRLAKQYALLRDAVNLASGVGGGTHYQRITATNVYDIESDLITHAHQMDEGMNPQDIVADLTIFVNMINDDVSHVTSHGYDDLDDYLSGVGLNVAPEYDDIYYAVRGTHLNAVNVFGPSIHMGSYEVLDTDTGIFTDLNAVGTGSGKRSDTNYAGAQIAVRVPTGITIGVSDIVATLYLTKEDGTSVTEDLTIPANTIGNDDVDVATTSGVDYIDVTNVTISGGTTGDRFEIYSVLERVIAL